MVEEYDKNKKIEKVIIGRNVSHHIYKSKKRENMIISINAEKQVDKF